MEGSLLLRDVELLGGRRADVRVANGTVVEVGALQRLSGEPVVEGGGGALSVGLADHHIHLLAMAAAADSVDVRVAGALAAAQPDSSGWIRGVGHAGEPAELPLEELDRLHPGVPVRVQHRSGAMWMLNSAALRTLKLDLPDGLLWRGDGRLAELLPTAPPPDLQKLGRELAAYGITAVTDATADLPARSQSLLTDAVADGLLPQRVMLLGAQSPAGLSSRISLGPMKIVPADHELPSLEWMQERIEDAREQGRAVAVHCVTREALALTFAALDIVGRHARDRIEHGALIDPAAIAELKRRHLTVVTQPGFIADRGDDYRRDLPGDLDDLYRVASLREAGIPVVCSSDAPYGPVDPWAVMRAAAERITPEGDVIGPQERIAVAQALKGYLSSPARPGGPPRKVSVGTPADLVLMHVPWAEVVAAPAADLVRSTLYSSGFSSSVDSTAGLPPANTTDR